MHNKHFLYRENGIDRLMLIAVLLCCVAFLGCPETAEMVDDVIQPVPSEQEPPMEPVSEPQEPTTPPGDDFSEPIGEPQEPATPPGDDFSEPSTPPPGDAEPGGDLSEPTAPTETEDPTEDPSGDDSGAGGLGG